MPSFAYSTVPSHNSTASNLSALKVLIIGGGPASLSTAKAFENIDIIPTIVERRKAYASEGAGIAIPANGSWALNQLGVSIQGIALPIPKITFTTQKGDILVEEDITKIHPQGEQFYAIDRTLLISHLKKSLKATKIKMGVSVTGLRQSKKDVTVSFSDKSQGVFDFVIVADGIHSKTRELLDSSYSARYGKSNYGANYLGITDMANHYSSTKKA